METLRDLLKQKNPELYSAFLETWKYAENKIYPSMTFKRDKESLNSLPHIRDNEHYLNGILPISDGLFDENMPFYISPYELYAILTANTLHDIGRASGVGKGHGAKSKEYINKNWRYYNIPNEELAKAIENICEIHEPKELENEKAIEIKIEIDNARVRNVVLEEKQLYEDYTLKYYSAQLLDNNAGIIRVNEMGALLSLIDNLDATYRRLAPLDVLDKERFEDPIALIRNCIKGVVYSKESQSVIVSITMPEQKAVNEKNSKLLIHLLFWLRCYNLFKRSDIDKITKIIKEANYCELNNDQYLAKGYSIFTKSFQKILAKDLYPEIIWQIISGVRISKPDNASKDFEVPSAILLAMILGNVRACHRSLRNKYKYLIRIGIPLKTWLISIDEHLYNYYGEETYEPVFSEEYLNRVALKMWELSTRVFGRSFFTYEMLASAVNEKDIALIKLAVKRLEIISRYTDENINSVSTINYNLLGWQWEFMERRKDEKKDEKKICLFRSYDEIKGIIEKLGKPILKSKK